MFVLVGRPELDERGKQECRWFLLADRTNGSAIATVLRPSSSSSSSATLYIVAKRCVLEQKLLLRAYRKSYMGNRLVQK